MEIHTMTPEDLGLPEKFSDFRPSEDDWCVSYNEQFRRLYAQYVDMFPRWWRDALVPCPPFLAVLSISGKKHWGSWP